MSHNSKETLRLKLDRLVDAFSEDVDALSDDEILNEAKEDGASVDMFARDFKASALSMVAQTRRKLLEEARANLARSHASQSRAPKARPTIEIIKLRIQEALSTRPQLAVAFRDGRKQSDEDWASLWDDLVELGAIEEKDGAS